MWIPIRPAEQMGKFRLHDWNDIRLLIAVAERGGFAGAAAVLGVDQSTVSRRITAMESAIGRPLFTRKRSGASPTAAGEALLERARLVEAASAEFETAMNGLSAMPAPAVTVGAGDGLLTYTIIPALLKDAAKELPLDRSLVRDGIPPLAFAALPAKADVSVIVTNPGDVPQVRGAVRVKRVGTVHLVPVATEAFLADHPCPSRFEDLARLPLLDIDVYRHLRAMEDWNGLVSTREGGADIVAPNTPALEAPLLAGKGVTILPPYSVLYGTGLTRLDVTAPRLTLSLWLVAHEDALREPSVRLVYDLLASMFQTSPWFRESCIAS